VDFNNPWQGVRPVKQLEVLQGHGTIINEQRSTVSHKYKVISKEDLLVRENTLYFPGWKLFAGGREIKLNYKNPRFPGIIWATIPAGYYDLELKFENTRVREIARNVSVWSAMILVGWLWIIILTKNWRMRTQ